MGRPFSTIVFFAQLILFTASSHAQSKQSTQSRFCDFVCSLPKEDEAHFNPYYNGHLCENFDPKQIDFSAEYLKLRTRNAGQNIIQNLAANDLSDVWLTRDKQQNGVIGLDCKRIKIRITSVTRDTKDKLLYHVAGKSKVNGNVCDFTGEIRLLRAEKLEHAEESEHDNAGQLIAEYTFYEDRTQKQVGSFKGIHESFYYIDPVSKKAFLDESSDIADGYFNRTYVGTWTSYTTKAVKKCIWGDYRLPFVFDFDCGDGEMMVCDKYVQNGWTSFNDATDQIKNSF